MKKRYFKYFLLAVCLAALVFAAFLVIIQSSAFWIGNSASIGQLAVNAMLTFAIYPTTLFDSLAKLILFTLIPAALMGTLPADFARRFTWQTLVQLLLGASILLVVAIGIFQIGLRRYESGSAIQTEI